jgi:signal transduction histidine kinase
MSNYSLPEHFLLTDNPRKGFITMQRLGDKFLLVNKKYIEDKLMRFGSLLFIWEIALVLSLNYILYKTIIRYMREREETDKLLEIMLLTISHKLGNFLSVQRLNLHLLKEKLPEDLALQRLERAYQLAERDFKTLTLALKNMRSLESSPQTVRLASLIWSIINHFDKLTVGKKISVVGEDVKLSFNRLKLENILFPVIENALFYSKRHVQIRICSREGIHVIIRNDIGKQSPGAGVGESIVRFLIESEGGKFLKRVYKGHYLVYLKLSGT